MRVDETGFATVNTILRSGSESSSTNLKHATAKTMKPQHNKILAPKSLPTIYTP